MTDKALAVSGFDCCSVCQDLENLLCNRDGRLQRVRGKLYGILPPLHVLENQAQDATNTVVGKELQLVINFTRVEN